MMDAKFSQGSNRLALDREMQVKFEFEYSN
jgi:hypothetical protein